MGGVTVSRNRHCTTWTKSSGWGVHAGDTVLIERAGEVIPHVLKVVKHGKEEKKFEMPDEMPGVRHADSPSGRRSRVPLRERFVSGAAGGNRCCILPGGTR